jgi:dienelactone hydrolase
MHIIERIALAIAVCAVCASAENWEKEVRALRPADVSPREEALLDYVQNRAKLALDAIPHARTREQAEEARPLLRRRLEESLGFRRLPPPDPQAKVVGTLQRDGYRIEKVVYQSLPGVPVAAHLYIPAGLQGRAPGVIFYTGHWWPDSKARPDFQAFCINMARLGFVVFDFDTFGQGERGISNRDHRRVEALLVGVSQQGLAEYETQCALHYLLSRKEVDPDRIGITGASGGGYNTWMTAALDDRIKVAVPVVGTSDFLEQIQVARGLDWYHANEHCHFVPGLIRYADNHELVAMAAPKPLLIVAASQDQSFPVNGVRQVAAYARELYRAYGIPEKTGYSEDSSTGHGYQQKKREAAYGWFLKWLMNRGDGGPYAEPATEPAAWDAPEMRCFPAGENRPAGPGIIEAVRKLAKGKPPAKVNPDFQNVFGRLPQAESLKPALTEARAQRVEFVSEPGITVPAFLVRPAGQPKGIVVAVDDRGKEEVAADPLVRSAVEKGWAVFGVDPRGIGESATSKKGWVSAVALLLTENFVWRQGWDVSRAIEYLEAAFPRTPVGLYARGDNASLAAVYAVAQRKNANLRWYALRDGFVTYRHFFERPESLKQSFALQQEANFRTATYDREIPFFYFGFDALRTFDLPKLMASAKAKGLVMDPIDGDWKLLPEAEARKILPAKVKVECGRTTAFQDLLK